MNIALIDLSGIFHMHWHATAHEEIGEAFQRTIGAVQSCVGDYDHTGVCIDWPPYRRAKIDPEYKAHREKAPAAMQEQHRAVIEQLKQDGYHVFGAKGYEADDIIATMVEWSEFHGCKTTIFSADKDMLQLVSPNTCVISTATRNKMEVQDVIDNPKFGVHPELIPDLLAFLGDKSDNIAGVKGVGPKTASKWLNSYGSLAGVIANVDALGDRWGPVVAQSKELLEKALELTKLERDAPISPEDITKPVERKEQPKPRQYNQEIEAEMNEPEIMGDPGPEADAEQSHAYTPHDPDESVREAQALPGSSTKPMAGAAGEVGSSPVEGNQSTPATQPMTAPALPPAIIEPTQAMTTTWDKSLEPKNHGQAWQLANMLHNSRMFTGIPNPEAILAVVMTGRAFGMDTVASLRGFHIIKWKICPSSQLLIGLVKKCPVCKWFRFVEGDETSATWETIRRDEPEPTRMTYTLDDARMAGLLAAPKPGKEPNQWAKRPKTMLRWRAGVELARIVYSDVVSGLYTLEEMQELKDAA